MDDRADDVAMPTAVTNYFAALGAAPGGPGVVRGRDLSEVFADDAVVTDDGRSYRGIDEVRGWMDGPATEWEVTYTDLSVQATAAGVVVTTRLEGNFPGGVVVLRNTFELNGAGRITSLSITV